MVEQIPGPYAWPVLGNMLDVRSEEGGSKALESLADIYGPVFQITLRGQKYILVSSAELLKQVADDKNFVKIPPPSLASGERPQGLFTARSESHDWIQAHRILMPAFNPLSVEDMFPEMMDVASQLCLKWARMGSETQILLTDDFTRLTLDTIALCAMDFRFNSFYQDSMHPFVDAMLATLGYAGKRSSRPWIYTTFLSSQEEAQFRANQQIMADTAQQIIDRRKANPSDRKDLLNTMIYAVDPKTGDPMRDELIGANMITFLVAGHETTSGLLSFAFTRLLQNPHAYLKAQKEVDDVLKGGRIDPKALKQLKYINAVLRETLRLNPTVPGLSKVVSPAKKNDLTTFCDGKYVIDPDTPVRVLMGKAMSDPAYFGEDAHEFNPDRMIDTNPNFDHYMAAWRPFGNGTRACIGQHFAWQEAVMVAALVLQNFDLSFVNPSYQLHVKQTLTVKPKDVYVYARLRKGVTPTVLNGRLHGVSNSDTATPVPHSPKQDSLPNANGSTEKNGLAVFYGSNSGTCQSLARKLASASSMTFDVNASIADLDSAVDNLTPDTPVVIVTSTYEGQPPDNAQRFVAWLEGMKPRSLTGVRYAVFGCGHKDWHDTFFRIPKLIDHALETCGAERICTMGTADISSGRVLDDFESWMEALLGQLNGSSTKLKPTDISALAEIHTDQRAKELSDGFVAAKVQEVRVLTDPDEPEKRHMEIALPDDTTYECGDYLAVLPTNPDALVKRIMAHWQLPWDATIVFKSKLLSSLPADTPLSIYDILKGFFELSQQISKRNLEALKHYTTDPGTLAQLDRILTDASVFEQTITSPQTSLFDYLSAHPDIHLPLAVYLSWLLPLRPRQYSISSSPLAHPSSCTITYTVLRTPGHEGVASTFLSQLSPGDTLHVALRSPPPLLKPFPFRLPTSPSTPLLLFCAGTGLAPFRGFLQHRAALPPPAPGPALLFVGCRASDADRLYADELDAWVRAGVVDVRYAFSRDPARSRGCAYVGDRVLADKEDVLRLWRAGARVYVCGGRGVLESVGRAARAIFEGEGKGEEGQEEGEKRFQRLMSERVVRDVFD